MNTELKTLEAALRRVLTEMDAGIATAEALRSPTPESMAKAKTAIEDAEKAMARFPR